MKKSFKFLTLVFTLSLVFACGNKKEQDQVQESVNPRVDKYMERSSEDTLMLIHMAKEYLDLLKDKDYDGALDLLYEINGKQVQPISATQRGNLLKLNQSFPVYDYTIDELLLYSDSDTEVRYTVQFMENVEDVEGPTTIKCSVHPKRIKGQWYLTIEDEKRER